MSKDERKDFYRSVAKGIERPLFSVYRRVIRMYDEKNYQGKYTPDELTRLRE
jgi:cyclin-D-binding Myb-like transcription factor 1